MNAQTEIMISILTWRWFLADVRLQSTRIQKLTHHLSEMVFMSLILFQHMGFSVEWLLLLVLQGAAHLVIDLEFVKSKSIGKEFGALLHAIIVALTSMFATIK